MSATPCSADPDAWFSDRNVDECREACFYCPILQACAKSAVDLRPTSGVWATVHMTDGSEARKHQFKKLRAIAAGKAPGMPQVIMRKVNQAAVVRLHRDGASVEEIAAALHIGNSTVRDHLSEAS